VRTDPEGRDLRGSAPEEAAKRPASPFSRLVVAHAVAVAGDALVTTALAGSLFFDISPTAAQGRVALSLVLTIAPFALVAPFLGPAIDRIRGGRRLMVFMAAGGRAVAAWFMASVLDGLLLFPATFVLLVLSKTHSVAKSSLVPTVVRSDEELVQANSKLALVSAVTGLVAAAPGVAVLELVGAEWVVRLAAVVFVAAAVLSWRIKQVRPDDPEARSLAKQELHDIGIRLAATAMGVLRGSVGFLTFLIAFTLRREEAPTWKFGAALAASMGATVVGAALAPRLRRRVAEEHLLAGSIALVVASGVAAWQVGGFMGDLVLAAAIGMAASTGKLAFDSLVQRDAPDATQGRSFARYEALFQLAWVVGALVPVVTAVPRQLGYALLMTAAAVSLVAYLVGLRRARRASRALAEAT
jgi:Major Facilitator Superfamily